MGITISGIIIGVSTITMLNTTQGTLGDMVTTTQITQTIRVMEAVKIRVTSMVRSNIPEQTANIQIGQNSKVRIMNAFYHFHVV